MMAVDRLENDDSVVHEHSDGQHEAHHGEDVEVGAHEVEQAAGRDDREWDRQRDDQRRIEPAQEEVETPHGQQPAHEPRQQEALDAVGDLRGLVVPDEDVDPLQQGIGADVVLEHVVDGVGHVHRVRRRLLEHRQRHGIGAVEVAAVTDRRLLVVDLRDVRQPEASLVDGEIRDLLDRGEFPHGARREAQIVIRHLAEHHIRRRALKLSDQLADVDVVRVHLVQDEVDEDLAWQHAIEIHPPDAGNAAQSVEDPRLDQLVARRQIDAVRRNPALDHRNVRRVEREDDDLADVAGQIRLDLVHLLADLHAHDVE